MKSKSYLGLSFLLILCLFDLQAQIIIESGGSLTILSGETVTVEGDLDNAGTLSGKGTLNIAGNYTNTGTFAIIIGPDQFTHTSVDVTGSFTPGGDFTVSNDSYTPTNGDEATIITSGSSVVSTFSNSEDNTWFAEYNLPNSGDFTIVYGSILPVELNSFQGQPTSAGNLLNWRTASEENNEGFEVQKSKDAMDWESIGFVEGKGTTVGFNSYEFVDRFPFLEQNYYRLKQMDYDGKFAFSNIISIKTTQKANEIRIYPNPTTGKIEITAVEEGQITILNSFGAIVKETAMTTSTLDISALPSGIYFISINAGNQIITERIIKN